jgi:hypothetical protein
LRTRDAGARNMSGIVTTLTSLDAPEPVRLGSSMRLAGATVAHRNLEVERGRLSALYESAIHVIASDTAGRSYFGGDPLLGPGDHWPTRDDAPLTFLARVSLPDIHRVLSVPWLPTAGALAFFYDTDREPCGDDLADRTGWAVIHVADVDEPSRGTPSRRSACGPALDYRPVSFSRIRVLRDRARLLVDPLRHDNAQAEALDMLFEEPYGGRPKHQVVGPPAILQNDVMHTDAQLLIHGVSSDDVYLEDAREQRAQTLGPNDWKLLFQIDSDETLQLCWADGGRLYFWVEAERAKHGRFERAWAFVQS